MDWIVRWAGARPNLARWIARDLSATVADGPRPGDNRDAHERVVAWEEPGPPQHGGVFRRLANAVAACDIFPRHLVTPLPEHRPVRPGDTVALHYHFLPGLDLVIGARVVACFDAGRDGTWQCGFTYRTLQGHPLCGEEMFSVEKDMTTGAVRVALRSWSRTAIWQARIGWPFVRRNQLAAGQSALDHLETLADAAHSQGLPFSRRRDLRTRLLCGDW